VRPISTEKDIEYYYALVAGEVTVRNPVSKSKFYPPGEARFRFAHRRRTLLRISYVANALGAKQGFMQILYLPTSTNQRVESVARSVVNTVWLYSSTPPSVARSVYSG
jgi:hypothetical protein